MAGDPSAAIVPVTCPAPACRWQTKVAKALIGKKIRCKKCGGIIAVSAPEGAVSIPAPTPVPEPVPVPAATPVATPPPPAEPDKLVIEPAPAATPPPAAPISPAVKPKTDTGQVTLATVALQNEVADLKAQLRISRHQAEEAAQRASSAERQAADAMQRAEAAARIVAEAEQRASEAEKALHDLAGKKAIEAMTYTRKTAEVEAKLRELQERVAALAGEIQSESVAAAGRAAVLSQKLVKLAGA
jgi:hypothetical protein